MSKVKTMMTGLETELSDEALRVVSGGVSQVQHLGGFALPEMGLSLIHI